MLLPTAQSTWLAYILSIHMTCQVSMAPCSVCPFGQVRWQENALISGDRLVLVQEPGDGRHFRHVRNSSNCLTAGQEQLVGPCSLLASKCSLHETQRRQSRSGPAGSTHSHPYLSHTDVLSQILTSYLDPKFTLCRRPPTPKPSPTKPRVPCVLSLHTEPTLLWLG